MNDSLSTWIPLALHTTHTLLPISSPNERIFNKHNNHNDSRQSNTANRWLDSSRPNPEQTSRIDQTLYACRQRRSENTITTETPSPSLLVNKHTLFPLTSSPNGISLIAQQRTPFFTPSITPSSQILSTHMTALTPTAIPDRAQHLTAAPLLLHMVLTHPSPSTVIEICTFNFEHFHQTISFHSSPARFPNPTRIRFFLRFCHSISA